jgi:hypothetical protein
MTETEGQANALSRFDSLMVDERHRVLARRALEQSARWATTPDHSEHAKQAFLASTFEVFCEPPLATLEESVLSIEFLLIVFKTDDASPVVLDELIPHLSTSQGSVPANAPGELYARYDELMKSFRRMDRDATSFRDALRSMCVSMQIEKRADKVTMTEEEFHQLRKEVIAVRAFAECWRTIRGVSFSPGLSAALRSSAILDTAAELAYLANDLGSLDRDEQTARTDPQSVDPNFVLLRMRTLGNREAAISEAIALHNAKIADFRRAEAQLLASEHGAEPALRGYLEILRCTVNGNLATTKYLVPMRYEGAGEPLSRLEVL